MEKLSIELAVKAYFDQKFKILVKFVTSSMMTQHQQRCSFQALLPSAEINSALTVFVDSVRMDFQLDQKISKRRFFQDIQNSFQ